MKSNSNNLMIDMYGKYVKTYAHETRTLIESLLTTLNTVDINSQEILDSLTEEFNFMTDKTRNDKYQITKLVKGNNKPLLNLYDRELNSGLQPLLKKHVQRNYQHIDLINDTLLFVEYCLLFNIDYKLYIEYLHKFNLWDLVISVAYHYSYREINGLPFQFYVDVKHSLYLDDSITDLQYRTLHTRDLELVRLGILTLEEVKQLPTFEDLRWTLLSRMMIANGDYYYLQMGLSESELLTLLDTYAKQYYKSFNHKFLFHLVESVIDVRYTITALRELNKHYLD